VDLHVLAILITILTRLTRRGGPEERAGLTNVLPRERIIAVTRKKMLCMGDSILGRASDSIDSRLDQCRRLCCDMGHG
jgi:hypothetical protein